MRRFEQRCWVIDPLRLYWRTFDKPGLFQPAIDRGQRRNRRQETLSADLILDRLRTDEADAAALEGAAQAQDDATYFFVVGLGREFGLARARLKSSPTALFVTSPPLVQPGAAARNALK